MQVSGVGFCVADESMRTRRVDKVAGQSIGKCERMVSGRLRFFPLEILKNIA